MLLTCSTTNTTQAAHAPSASHVTPTWFHSLTHSLTHTEHSAQRSDAPVHRELTHTRGAAVSCFSRYVACRPDIRCPFCPFRSFVCANPAYPSMSRTPLPASFEEYSVYNDKVFLRIARVLPQPLKSALEVAELLDPGLLRSCPRSSWDLAGAGTCMRDAAQLAYFFFYSPGISPTVTTTVPPT